jgi:DNA-binding CsgD family transcriptional regulator
VAKVTPFERVLTAARLPTNALERRTVRLMSRVRSSRLPIVWLCAGGGAGKSRLLEDLARSRETAAARWMLLDDPGRDVLKQALVHPCRLVIASRPTSPAAQPLLRQRVYGQVEVIEEAELWVTPEDFESGPDRALMEMTGGWPMLVDAHLRGRGAALRNLLPAFLEREVLPVLPEPILAAAYAALTAPLTPAALACISGGEAASHPILRGAGSHWQISSVWVQEALFELRRSPAFVTPGVRQRLKRFYSALTAPERAIVDLATMGETEEALELFKNCGGVFFGYRHGYRALEAVLHAFGAALEQRVEELYLARLWLLIKSAKPREALLKLEDRHPGLPVDLRKLRLTHRAEAVLLRIDMALDIDSSPPPEIVASWGRLQSFLPAGDDIALGLLYNSMAIGFLQSDSLVEAKRLAEESLAAYAAAGSSYLVHCMHLHLCDIALRQSRLQDSARLLREAESALENSGHAFNSERSILSAFDARLAYEEGRLGDAPAEIEPILAALLAGDSWPDLIARVSVPFVLAGYWNRGLRHALDRLDECALTMNRRHGNVAIWRLALLRIRLMQVARHHAEADMLLEEYDLDLAARRSEASSVEEGIIRLRQAVLHGRSRAAISRLADTLSRSPHLEVRQRISISILKSGAAQLQGAATVARRHLRAALREAESQNLVAVFLEDGELVERVIPGFIAAPGPGNSTLAQFGCRILRLLKSLPAAPLNSKTLAGVSRQEHRVLSYVTDGYTNKQIGRALSLSESTVKFHLRSLFKKFAVRSRGALAGAMRARGIAT